MAQPLPPPKAAVPCTSQDNPFPEYDVYRDISNIIFGSLDIEVVLENLSRYLADFFPLSGVALFTFNPHTRELKLMTEARRGKIRRKTDSIILPKEAVADGNTPIFDSTSASFFMRPRRYDNTLSSSVYAALFSHFWPHGYSSLLVPLFTGKNDQLFSLAIYHLKPNTYSEKDLQLVSTIRQPLTMAFANLLEYERLSSDKEELKRRNKALVTESEGAVQELLAANYTGLRPLLEILPAMAQSDSTVLITGETGVGKELFASAIHQLSKRKSKPFIKVNCGGITESLIDSALFGHEKGAFTGAVAQHQGFFEQAQGGTIFLDEIGELSLPVQVRLLRVLQFKEIQRLGSRATTQLNIRVIAATHRDLAAMVKEETFREDLWFRLNILPMHIPPLRERRDDIPRLASHILRKKCKEMNIRDVPMISQDAMARLSEYSWPGNVRELENTIERLLILKRKAFTLGAKDTPLHAPDHFAIITQTSENGLAEKTPMPHSLRLDDAIRAHILAVLQRTNGKIQGPSGAAEILGINSGTLRSRMKKLGILEPRALVKARPDKT